MYDGLITLNARLAPADKFAFMRMLRQVAYADGGIAPHEEALLRQLAGLLYVADADAVRAKLAVTEGTQS